MSKPELTESEKALRQQAALSRKVADDAIKALVAEYDLAPRAAGIRRKLLNEAQRLELVEQGRDIIIQRLFPKALAVWEAALDSGNIDVATRVIEGMAIIASIAGFAKPSDSPASAETFEQYREIVLRHGTRATAFTPGGAQGSAQGAPEPRETAITVAQTAPIVVEGVVEADVPADQGSNHTDA